MNNAAIPFITSQLTYQAPTVIICLIAIALATQHFDRAPKAAWLAILGAGLLAGTAILMTLLQGFLLEMDDSVRALVNMFGVGLRALALGMLVAAIFADRPPRSQAF